VRPKRKTPEAPPETAELPPPVDDGALSVANGASMADGAGGDAAPEAVAPPSAPPPAPPAPLPRAAAAAPHVPRAPAPEPAPAAPPPVPHDARTADEWRRTVADRDLVSRRQGKPMPQGETMLVQAWLTVLRSRRIPPSACTIHVRRVEPEPIYDLVIPGEVVAGEHPDRQLHEYIERNRRQPSLPEHFLGRIQAMTATGEPMDLGWGDLYLAPQQQNAAAPLPWGAPSAAAPTWGPAPPTYGAPPQGWPYGSPQQPPPYGAQYMPPPGYVLVPAGAAPYGQPPAPPAPPPPPQNHSDPMILEMWKEQMRAHNRQVELHQEMLNRGAFGGQQAAAAPARDGKAELDNTLTTLDRVLSLVDKIRPPVAESSGGGPVAVHTLGDGTTLVSNREGIDKDTTQLLIGKSMLTDVVKTIGDRLAKARAAAPGGAGAPSNGGASHPPRRVLPGGS